jgi:hypothetical protein
MATKAINNTTRPNSLVPTLLIFRAYLQITEYNPPTPLILQRAKAIKKAITKI